MSVESTWFDEPTILEREIRVAYGRRGVLPEIEGYESLIEIARGGQGVVYRAHQQSTKRTVAVKVLRDAAPGEAERRRFEREVDLAAGLRHPGIVSIHDSGLTRDGRPYLVMEFVEGEPVDRHLGEEPSIRDTVALLAEVCDAVAHAHLRGVIHRDLKPGNIRVDTDGRARVLDFGLARLSGDPAMTVSGSGHFIGSLPWASPEQAEGRTQEIDVRSDVYALGVVLYQLLAGVFPYDMKGGMRAALDNIVDTPPARPSSHRADIDNDLETILLKCLSKEPERRYQSAGELARDLRRYLNGEPIEAKRDSAWYTIRKRIVRYRVLTGVSTGVLVLSLVALVAVNQFRLEAQRQRDLAAEALEDAREINTYMEETFSAVDPFADSAIDTPLREVLDHAAAEVDTRFADRPRLRSSVHEFLGNTYWNLGRLDLAADHLRAALEAQQTLDAPDELTLIDLQNNLGAVLADLLEFDEAERHLLAAERLATQILPPDDELAITVTHNRGYLLHYQGRMEEAAAKYQEALEAERRVFGDHHEYTLGTMNCYAPLLSDMGRLEEAHALFEDTVAGRTELLGAEHPSTLLARQNLAQSHYRLGRVREAAAIQAECAPIFDRVLGPTHPWTVSNATNLATSLARLGRTEEAEAICRSLLEHLAAIPDNDLSLLITRLALGRTLIAGDEHAQAVSLLREVYADSLEIFGPDGRRTLAIRTTLAEALAGAGDLDEAESILREVIAMHESAGNVSSTDLTTARLDLSAILLERGHLEEARAQAERARAAAAESAPEGHWLHARADLELGRALLALDRPAEAEKLFAAAAERFAARLGPEHPLTSEARGLLPRSN